MAEFPALPLWTDAYLADTTHLSDAETGLYLKLLIFMWRAPKCRLPNDDEWLARKFERSVQDIEKQLRPLMHEFCQTTGNWIMQKRLHKEWQWCRAKSQKGSDAANARWRNKKAASDRNADGHSVGNAPTPTPTLTKDSRSKKNSLNGHADEFEQFWQAYPRKVAKGNARTAFVKAIEKISIEALLSAVKNQSWSPDPKYRPHPATWLNQERWLDENKSQEDWKRAIL